jgi:hypothetical protein
MEDVTSKGQITKLEVNGDVSFSSQARATPYPWRHKPGDDFSVLEDPDGSLFCVVQVAET